MSLADEPCAPRPPGSAALSPDAWRRLAAQVPDWQVEDGTRLRRVFALADFRRALALVDRIGAEAEAQDHHPELLLAWGRVEVTLWSHDVGGLSRADFVLAARIDRLAADGS